MIRHLQLTSILLIAIMLLHTKSMAQKEYTFTNPGELPPLSKLDSIGLANLPVLTLPNWLKGPNAPKLPEFVDNSEQPHWRPVFAQQQYECGQASGIGLGFAYAINRMRDAVGTIPQNQYATHFTWNFGNGGDGWYGVSYFHSFEIVKWEGTPTVEVYGGMSTGGPARWMTGYDSYYQSMHNRVSEVYQIQLNTEEGINTLRNWIDNHLDGSDVGGVANFYTNAPGGMPTLPSGTPEAGKYVVTGWNYANHGLTICGYHDSIRWDYNSDGQYTNNLDLNGDGEITPSDWEIGGFKFANTYSGGPSFGNNGFCYMTYKSCADPYGDGGIWNNAAHVLYVKENVDPQLTAKIKITYDCRYKIRVQMGMSTDGNATSPDYVLGYPLFNFQGGCQYMQGGDEIEDNKIIEFGLDITPFLNMIEPGTPARYFLLVQEDDPLGWGNGQINNFSIIDYTDGMEEIVCSDINVTIASDTLTKMWVNHTVDYEEVTVSTDTIPDATVYEPYSAQLDAEGGTEPYIWDFDRNYTETSATGTFPMVTAEQLNPGNSNSGYAVKTLDFSFPFYGQNFNQVRVHVDGHITFEELLSWPYQVYDFLKWAKNKYISPFQADLRLYSGDGIWYEGDENSATFRWKASVNELQNTTELNFAVELFSNGDIKFFYGNVNDYPNMEWLSGISAGDSEYYQFTEISNDLTIPAQLIIDLEASKYPSGMEVSRTGQLSGVVTQTYDDFEIKFLVTDENNLTDSKTILFSTDGSNYLVVKNVTAFAGDDNVIEFGETVQLTVQVESLGLETIYGADMQLSSSDPYITLLDNSEFLGDFDPGEIKEFALAFSFDVANDIPDEYSIDLISHIADNSGEEWLSHIYLTAYAPDIYAANIVVDDGDNGGLDPGETADLIVTVYNEGGADAENIIGTLACSDPLITINSAISNLAQLSGGGTGEFTFNVTASDLVPVGYIVEFELEITANNGYIVTDMVHIICGLLNEGFETGDFSSYPWSFGGNLEWQIDNSTMWEGSFSARSGNITHDQTSSMQLELFVLSNGVISFYKKVSSEANYDFLRFYIDGVEKAAWDGEQDWTQESFNITQGIHTVKWEYEKDYSVNTGSDCGWIDYIILPPFGDQNPQIFYDPETLIKTLGFNTLVLDTIHIQNIGTGPVLYTLDVVDTTGNVVEWLDLSFQNGGLNPGDEDELIVAFDATNLEEGLYKADIVITDHIDNEYPIACWLYLDLTTGISEDNSVIKFGNAPNPFEKSTQLWFELEEPSTIHFQIYTNHGERVKTLIPGSFYGNGRHTINWDGTNDAGREVSSGIYYYQIQLGEQVVNGKMIRME